MLYRRVLFLAVLTALPVMSLSGLIYEADWECERLEALERSLEEQDRIAAALPPGVSMAMRFATDWYKVPKGKILTVRDRLAELDARLENGKLCAKSGKMICFFKPNWPRFVGHCFAKDFKQGDDHLIAELSEKCEVIVLYPPYGCPRF